MATNKAMNLTSRTDFQRVLSEWKQLDFNFQVSLQANTLLSSHTGASACSREERPSIEKYIWNSIVQISFSMCKSLGFEETELLQQDEKPSYTSVT